MNSIPLLQNDEKTCKNCISLIKTIKILQEQIIKLKKIQNNVSDNILKNISNNESDNDIISLCQKCDQKYIYTNNEYVTNVVGCDICQHCVYKRTYGSQFYY
jgi:homospermidine synthase